MVNSAFGPSASAPEQPKPGELQGVFKVTLCQRILSNAALPVKESVAGRTRRKRGPRCAGFLFTGRANGIN